MKRTLWTRQIPNPTWRYSELGAPALLLCLWMGWTGCTETDSEANSTEEQASDVPVNATEIPPVDEHKGDLGDQIPDSESMDSDPEFDGVSEVDLGPDREPPVWTEYVTFIGTCGPDRVSLGWLTDGETDPVTDNVGVKWIRIYQDGVLIATLAWPQVMYEVLGLAPDTTYLFEAEAGDAAGNWTVRRLSREFRTECATYWQDKCPVSWPLGSSLTATIQTDGSVRLVWTPAYDGMEVTGYRVLQDGVCLCVDTGVPSTNKTVAGDVLEFLVPGLDPGTYHFQISARDNVWEKYGGGGWILGPETSVTIAPNM